MKQIDSIQPPASRQRPVQAKKPRPQSSATGARFTAFANTKRRRFVWSVALPVVLSPFLFGLVVIGVAGMAVVAIYGFMALVRRWPSRVSFLLALLALVYMALLQLGAATDAAQAMAVLAYIFLAFGVISLALEVKMSNRMWFKKH